MTEINIDLVDQIFDEIDGVTIEMLEDWRKNTNWGDRDELLTYLRLKHMAKRSSALNKLVPDRICPECKTLESRDSHWRIDRFHSAVICSNCFRSNHNFRKTFSKFSIDEDEWKLISLMRQIFLNPQTRYEIDGKKFGLMRAILGISQVKLAGILGMASMTICKIEIGEISTMERDKIILCMDAFRDAFIKRLSDLGYTDIELERFKWNKPDISVIE